MRKITQPIYIFFSFFLDKSRNLFKFVSVLLSASVERVCVSRMRDFLFTLGGFFNEREYSEADCPDLLLSVFFLLFLNGIEVAKYKIIINDTSHSLKCSPE